MSVFLQTAAEWVARQLRWRQPLCRVLSRRKGRAPAPRTLGRDDIERTFAEAGLVAGDTVLVHATTAGVRLRDRGELVDEPGRVVGLLTGWLREIAGPSVTLVMPTYPMYLRQGGFMDPVGDRRLIYNPDRTLSKTGLLSEHFRRQPGAVRSPLPLQSLAALGPRAEDLIRPGELPSDIPPHGLGTPHHRLCLANALVVGLGLPLHRYLTLVHVAEDLRFTENLARNFYRRRHFTVIMDQPRDISLWERRPEMARVFCARRFRADILSGGLLREGRGGSQDWIRSGELLRFMMDRTSGGSTYPYFLPRLAGPFAE